MAKTRNIPIRFPDQQIRAMAYVGKEMGLENRSDVVKFAVKALCDYVKEHGAAGLRPQGQMILRELDGRTHRYRTKKETEVETGEDKQ
jgi:hypothetical protein